VEYFRFGKDDTVAPNTVMDVDRYEKGPGSPDRERRGKRTEPERASIVRSGNGTLFT